MGVEIAPWAGGMLIIADDADGIGVGDSVERLLTQIEAALRLLEPGRHDTRGAVWHLVGEHPPALWLDIDVSHASQVLTALATELRARVRERGGLPFIQPVTGQQAALVRLASIALVAGLRALQRWEDDGRTVRERRR